MNVTTFTPSATTSRRASIPVLSNIPSLIKKVFLFFFSKPRRIFFTVLAILAAVGLYNIFFSRTNNDPIKVLPLKQSFTVVAKTKDGRNTNGNLKIDVTGTYKSESLLVQGQRVIARNGKNFLVVNMDLSNTYNVALYTYPVDNFRLVGTDGKKYAPTAHQGNVEIRPQSTKTSNIGFIVPKDQSKFKVEIGELNSDKVLLEFTIK